MNHGLSDYDVSVVVLRAIVAGGAALGVDTEALLATLGITPGLLDDRSARVPRSLEEKTWRVTLARCDDPEAVGAFAALRSGRGAFGLLEYAVRTAATVDQGVDVLVSHSAILHGVPLFTAERGSSKLVLQYHLPHDASEAIAPPAAELALGSVTKILSEASVGTIQPESIELAHGRTKHDLGKLLGVPAQHQQNRFALVFESQRCTQAMRDADAILHDILCDQLRQKLEELSAGEPFAHRVRRAVEQLLPFGAPSLQQVASMLGMASRTLQARLGENDTTFRELITAARLERAKLYLTTTDMPIASIASLAGYSDERSLYRSFRRQYDITPDGVRRAGRTSRSQGR